MVALTGFAFAFPSAGGADDEGGAFVSDIEEDGCELETCEEKLLNRIVSEYALREADAVLGT